MRENISLPSLRGEGLGERLLGERLLLERLLPSWRLDLALRYKHAQGQLECALSYLLLQQLLEEEFGFRCEEPFAYNEHGKPYLPSHPEVHFNLSHCKQAVACIVSREGEVGIDVESLGRYTESLAEHVLNPSELTEVRQSPDPDLTFTRLWTRKEALLKQQGTGITDDIKHILSSLPTNTNIATHNYPTFLLSLAWQINGAKRVFRGC